MLTDQTTAAPIIKGLKIEALRFVRGDACLFDALSVSLMPGQGLWLRGANGSGKSTILKLMAGLLTPAAGRIAFDGVGIAADLARYRRHIAYLGHLDGLKAAETPRQALEFRARLRTSPSWERSRSEAERVRVLCGLHPHPTLSHEGEGLLGIQSYIDLPIRYLSAGQRRRVALAGVLAAGARLWLLDEPATALDDAGQALMYDALKKHVAAGGMFVVATHDAPPAIDGESVLTLVQPQRPSPMRER